MNLYTISSELHRETSYAVEDDPFLRSVEDLLDEKFVFRSDFCNFDTSTSVLYIRTGGTEGRFRDLMFGSGKRSYRGTAPLRILASGQSNSLAASMEIISFLRRNHERGRIIHGSREEMAAQLKSPENGPRGNCIRNLKGNGILQGKRFGVVGKPSDWLISSDVDYNLAEAVLGCRLRDIPMSDLISLIPDSAPEIPGSLNPLGDAKFGKVTRKDLSKAAGIYEALRKVVENDSLDGVTLRCFDLLRTVGSTGCLALGILNSEGKTATCEGDIPALLSMAVAREVASSASFQANLSRIEGKNRFLFAHCTVPLSIVSSYCYDSHFESGIGVGIHGEFAENEPVTLFKIGADLKHYFLNEGIVRSNLYASCLCRTQIWVESEGMKDYMLSSPLGNHHIIIPGRHARELQDALEG